MVELVLKAGADLKLPQNQLAVCAAVALGHGNILQMFIRDGVNLNPEPKCDGDRRSRLRLARESGDEQAAERLLVAGAEEDY